MKGPKAKPEPAPSSAAGADGDKVPALTKAIAIVRQINAAGTSGASLLDLHVKLGITKSHCFNILKGLVREGWLAHDESRRAYTISPRLLNDVSSAFSPRRIGAATHEELERLTRSTQTPSVLSRVAEDGSFIVVDTIDSAEELMFTARIGHRFPPDAPAQMRVRLAWMDPGERQRVLSTIKLTAYTPNTITNKNELLREIEITRARGYGISRAEYTPGVFSVSAPIFNAFGQVDMILQSTGISAKITDEGSVATKLLAASKRLNAMLGDHSG